MAHSAYTQGITKQEFVAEMRKHQAADRFLRGQYWNEQRQKGCSVGCGNVAADQRMLRSRGAHMTPYEQRIHTWQSLGILAAGATLLWLVGTALGGCASAPTAWNPESQAPRGRAINPSVLQGDDWAVRRCMVLRAEGVKCEPEP